MSPSRTLFAPFVVALFLGTTILVIARQALAEPPSASALPDPLTLADALKAARVWRHEPLAAKARADAAAALPRSVSKPPDPMLMTSIDHLPFSLAGVNWSVMIQQEFPMSGVLGARAREARANADAERTGVDTTSLDVEAQAGRAFAMLAEAQGMRRVIAEQSDLASRVALTARARVASGSGMAADLVRAQADVADLDGALDAADANIESSAAMLLAAIGLPRTTPTPTCTMTMPSGEPLALEDLVDKAIKNRPELQAMRFRTTAATDEVDVMKSMYLPMGIARIGFADTMDDGPGVMTSFGVSLPIWRNDIEAGVTHAKQMVRMTKEETTAMQRMIEGDVGGAREKLVGAMARAKSLRAGVLPLASEAVDLALADYAGGQAPFVSILEAEQTVREKKMEQIARDASVLVAWVELGRTVGTFDLDSLVHAAQHASE